jgi:hypothetical protein
LALTLTTKGGNGTGRVTFAVSNPGSAHCTLVMGKKLKAAKQGRCRVTASKAGDTNYLSGRPTTATVTFTK